ncbi:MAG: hypothetical protein GY813_19405 [Halieaceae bacterium]|nr:hypothetical protein [Halieaceae bacterium]
MAGLPTTGDPTLQAADAALEVRGNAQESRGYYGTYSAGDECTRKQWLAFRWVAKKMFAADVLRRFEDGHMGEDLQTARLKCVDDLILMTLDPTTGEQFEFTDCDGHMGGHCDGQIKGLLQAPKTPHIWEHKQCADKKLKQLEKAKKDGKESDALRQWDWVYFIQAQIYMHEFKFTRHYLTCASPGGRKTISVRTHYEKAEAMKAIDRASMVIQCPSPETLSRISNDETFFKCKWCDFSEVCYGHSFPLANCRTCVKSTPVKNGEWHCAKWDSVIPLDGQRQGCEHHVFIPALITMEMTDAADDSSWAEYKMPDGELLRNGREWVQSQELSDAGLAATSIRVMTIKKPLPGDG